MPPFRWPCLETRSFDSRRRLYLPHPCLLRPLRGRSHFRASLAFFKQNLGARAIETGIPADRVFAERQRRSFLFDGRPMRVNETRLTLKSAGLILKLNGLCWQDAVIHLQKKYSPTADRLSAEIYRACLTVSAERLPSLCSFLYRDFETQPLIPTRMSCSANNLRLIKTSNYDGGGKAGGGGIFE